MFRNTDPPEPGGEHYTGFMLDRQRVGVPVGSPPTVWDYPPWDRFYDTFDLAEALAEVAAVKVSDDDGIATVLLVASTDGGATWSTYPMTREDPESDWWLAAAPVDLVATGEEILYYFESTDAVGSVRVNPWTAPSTYYEFSVLPIVGSVEEPGLLLVDKCYYRIPGEDRTYRHHSEDYYREMLDILGYEYDVYDARVATASPPYGNGPGEAGMEFYDTQVWFSGRSSSSTVTQSDQITLVGWLAESGTGAERNLLLTGSDIGRELVGEYGETLDFYTVWLASDYLGDRPGTISDTMPGVRDVDGGSSFMTHGDSQCFLWDDG